MKPFRIFQENFSLKVLASFLAAMLLLGVTFTFFFIRSQQKSFEKELFRDGAIHTKMLAHSARIGVFAEDIGEIYNVLGAAFQAEGILEACVLDRNKKYLARLTGIGQPAPEKPLTAQDLAFFDKVESGALSFLQTKDKIDFWAPIRSGKVSFSDETLFFDAPENKKTAQTPVIGFVGLSFDRKLLNQGIKDILIRNLLILLLFLFIGGLISFLIIRAATRPLNKLIKDVEAHGVEVESADQLGMLAGTFETMVRQLGDTFETVNDLKKGLEKKILELGQEVTVRRQAEKALQESEETARTLLNAPAYIAALIDVGGMVIDANIALAETLNIATDKLIGRNLWDLLPDDAVSRKRREMAAEVIRSGEPIRFEDQREGRWFDSFFFPIKDQAGNTGRLAILAQDITAGKEAEKKRQEMEIKALTQSKLASLGQIATGIAHEINQPLSYIKMIYQTTLRDLETERLNPDELQDDFMEALRQVNRIATLTDHLRTFGHSSAKAFEPVDLPSTLNNSLILMGERLKTHNISLSCEINDDLPPVFGNTNKLEQVFINLFQNAIDALAETGGGEVRVNMDRQDKAIRIRFSDSGPGVPDELQDKIFEPFFTTKEVGKGTGLGLAIVYGIIQEHQGSISCQSEPGWNASFVIDLPPWEKSPELPD